MKVGTGRGASEREEDRGRGRPVLFSLSEFSEEGQGRGEIPRMGT